MTAAETYLVKVRELKAQHQAELNKHAKDFALANNPHKVGDVIEDRQGKIRIEKIQWSYGNSPVYIPCCVYEGLVLKKDGTPTKKKDRRSIWQGNLINK